MQLIQANFGCVAVVGVVAVVLVTFVCFVVFVVVFVVDIADFDLIHSQRKMARRCSGFQSADKGQIPAHRCSCCICEPVSVEGQTKDRNQLTNPVGF